MCYQLGVMDEGDANRKSTIDDLVRSWCDGYGKKVETASGQTTLHFSEDTTKPHHRTTHTSLEDECVFYKEGGQLTTRHYYYSQDHGSE